MYKASRRISIIALAALVFCTLSFARPRKADAFGDGFMFTDDGTLWAWVSMGASYPAGFYHWIPLGKVASLGSAFGGTAGGALLGPTSFVLATLAGSLLIAGGVVIAIDCATHDECIWTAVSNAGGIGVVSGWSPSPSAAPLPSAVTVNCSDPRPLTTQCLGSPLRNVITSYASCPWCSNWTCGQVWDNGATSGDADWMAALGTCNSQASLCVAMTANTCLANNIARDDIMPIALDPAVAE